MSRTSTLRLSLIALAILAAALAPPLWTKAEVQVSTAQVTEGPMTRRVVAAGSLQAVRTVDVGSQESGIVQTLLVDYNSFVHAGDIVARLDPSIYDAQYQAAQAVLGEATAALVQARANVAGFQSAVNDAQSKLSRASALSLKGLIPQSDFDAAQIAADEAAADLGSGTATIRQAEAAVTEARASLDQAAVNVEHTIIRAPIDGIVIDRDVDVGQTLAASVQAPVLFRLAADLTQMQVQVNVDESDVGALTEGATATFSVESFPGEMFHGVVSQVRLQPVTEAATAVVSYTAIVDVPNPDQRLRPGMTAEVVVSGHERPHVIRIPNSALSFRPPADVLQAIGEREPALASGDRSVREVWEYDGKRFMPFAIHAGLADGGWTELVSGDLHPGDALVTTAVVHRRSRL